MSSSTGTVPSTPKSPDAQPGQQVLDALQAIDNALLDKLIEVRGEQKQLEAFRAKAAGLKETYKPPVWQRVMEDYTARLSALEKQAAPLTEDVRREYQKLRALHDGLTKSNNDARLAKEELELREAVGELSKEELTAKLAAPQSALDGFERDLAAVEAQRARFIEAVGSPEALEAPAPAPAAPVARAPVALKAEAPKPEAKPEPKVESKPDSISEAKTEARPAVKAEPRSEAKTEARAAVPAGTKAEPKTAAKAPVVQDPSADAETVMRVRMDTPKSPAAPAPAPPAAPQADAAAEPSDVTRVVLRTPGPAAPKASPSPSALQDQQTFVLPQATLRITAANTPASEHRLGPSTSLGRTEDNQIQIARPGVSRHHAVIEFTPGGFALKDLGSQNGTFLNGDRVTTHALTDGDRILIGDAQLVFRLL